MDREKAPAASPSDGTALPTHENDAVQTKKTTKGIKAAGESGRRGFHPLRFLRITWRSSSRASKFCNILWPAVPTAIALRCKSSAAVDLSP